MASKQEILGGERGLFHNNKRIKILRGIKIYSNDKTSKDIKQKLKELKTEIENFTIIIGNFKPRLYLALEMSLLINILARQLMWDGKACKTFFTIFQVEMYIIKA